MSWLQQLVITVADAISHILIFTLPNQLKKTPNHNELIEKNTTETARLFSYMRKSNHLLQMRNESIYLDHTKPRTKSFTRVGRNVITPKHNQLFGSQVDSDNGKIKEKEDLSVFPLLLLLWG